MSGVGAIVGAWTPLMTGGRAGALAERAVGATGRTLRTAGQHVVSEVSRLDIRIDRSIAGTAFGNVNVSVKPRAAAVRSSSAPHITRTVPAATSAAAAEWTQPMRAAPKVEFTAPPADMRASVPHYEPVVRPTVSVHVDTVPSHPVRPMVAEPVITHSSPAATAPKVKPTVEPVVESTVSGAQVNTKVFNPTDKCFYDKVGEYDGAKYYREKGSKFWYSKDKSGDRAHASTWKLYRERGKKIVKVQELNELGEKISRNPSDTLKEIKLKDMAMQGGGR